LVAKGFQYSTSKSHKKEKSSSLPFIGMKRIFLFYEIYW